MMRRGQSSKAPSAPAFAAPMAAQSIAELPRGGLLYQLKLNGSPYSWTVSHS